MTSHAPQTVQQYAAQQRAAQHLIEVYQTLQKRGRHLLAEIADVSQPMKYWQHYPDANVIDTTNRAQYFYHVHDPADRTHDNCPEHGHFHIFYRLHDSDEPQIAPPLVWQSPNLSTGAQRKSGGLPSKQLSKVVHLVSISLNPQGVPIRLFTVNQWVTNEVFCPTAQTIWCLERFKLNGRISPKLLNKWLNAMLVLYHHEICDLLQQRDYALVCAQQQRNQADLKTAKRTTTPLLRDQSVEVLSQQAINLDEQIQHWLAQSIG